MEQPSTPTDGQRALTVLRLISAAVAASAAATLFCVWLELRADYSSVALYLVLGALAVGAAVSTLLGLRRTTFILALVAFLPMGAYLLLGAGLAFVGGILIAATLSLSVAMLRIGPRRVRA